ncbi:hypothetical protein PYW08_011192 [Mythimna loreyi]|uniref:Uncharacterized protein n=1 Tax=Mythimna loreyi TaxID=667449 RepID=A0ACC2Q392_9NEOP|nr:hypothetical protein PYW08_011192 [Mythimna loreyi]
MDTLDKATLDKLQELIEASSEPGKPPSRKVLMELLDSVDLADDVKENLKAMLIGDVPKVFGSYAGGTYLAIVFILLVFALILFFGYKLYKSIKEKEIKREEKKKAKQMKKKK